MANTVKPVSDAMRKILAALGETPEQHQREKLGQRKRPAKDTYTPPKLKPASAVVASWKMPEPVWLADARVLFTRTRTCRSCGATASEMHHIETFIRMRSKTDPTTIKYIPARSSLFANLELPKLTINEPMFSFYCPLCWAHERPLENPVCLSELVSLPPAATGSSGESTAPANGSPGSSPSNPSSPPSSGFPSLQAAMLELSQISSSSTEDLGYGSSGPAGSDFASSSPNGLAPAQPTPTHTV